MTILKRLTSSVAATALTLSILTPVAVADRGDRERFNTRIDRVDRTDRRAERRADRRQERRSDRRTERRDNRADRRQDRRTERRADRREFRSDQRNDRRADRRQERRVERRADRREVRAERRGERRAERRFERRQDRQFERRQERRADRRTERRFANRVENRQIRRNAYRDGYRDARRYNYRNSGFRYHQPRRVYRSRPRYYKPYYSRPYKSGVIFGRYHRPNYRYSSRYHIGGFYGYHRDTVFIKDYWSYGLYDPPHGYHWVRDYNSGDVILASIATGAIIGLIIGALSY